MTVYRITNIKYKDDLSGNGARLYGGRWNLPGLPVIYCAEHISLSVLEMLVNITIAESQLKYQLLQIHIPDNTEPAIISGKKLKTNWQDDEAYTRFIGTEFLKNKQSLLLKVPSAVIEEENNFLVNPLHGIFKKVTITKSYPFKFDNRLFSY